jgi:hypothetical protein
MVLDALDNEARIQLVREWLRSPLKQTEFCTEKGISTRALREWVRRFGAGDRPEARAIAIIDEALEKLTALRAALVAEEACRVGDEGDDTDDEQHLDEDLEDRHAEPAKVLPVAPPAPPATRPSPSRPRRGGGFDWEAEEAEPAVPQPVGQTPVTPPSPTASPAASAAPLPMPAPGMFMLG